MKKCNLSNLLKDTTEAYYWIGFILADGHIDNSTRLKVVLSKKDKEHLIKLQKFLNVETLSETEQVSISAMDSKILRKFCSKFDINSNKTEFPPNLEAYKNISNALFTSLFIGFIDGDGSIGNLWKRKDFHIRIKCHNSWLEFLKLAQERLSISTIPQINKQGYSVLIISNTEKAKELKTFVIENSLPVLNRKWDIVDMKYKSRYIIANERIDIIKKQLLEGKSQREIREGLKMSASGISLLIKRKNL